MKHIYTMIFTLFTIIAFGQQNLVLNGTGDDHGTGSDTSNTSDNADAWDMTPNSTLNGDIASPYKVLWNNSTLEDYLEVTYMGGNSVNEQPGATSDGTYQSGSKTRALKLYGSSAGLTESTRRLYQKITVEAGEQYKFSMDSRSEAENIPSEVFMLNEEITTEVGLENGAADARVDHYFEITNDHNTSKGSATDNTFTNNSFTFTASTTTVVIYVRALLAIDSSTEVFYDNISLVKEATASIDDVSGVDVKVYPNPTTGLVNISTNENINSIAIHDLLGRKVLASQTNLKTVDVSSLTKGIYLLQLNLQKGQLTKKLIVE